MHDICLGKSKEPFGALPKKSDMKNEVKCSTCGAKGNCVLHQQDGYTGCDKWISVEDYGDPDTGITSDCTPQQPTDEEIHILGVDIKQDSCGVNASAVLLEENQPRCKEFDNE